MRVPEIVLKRVFDVTVSTALLIVFGPVFLLIAAAIKLDSPGPVLFSQYRVGLYGRLFRIYKFRSMTELRRSTETARNNGVSRIGKFIRSTLIDELPQLFNVLKGDMSLVGPRPEIPHIVDEYTPLQRRRLWAVPGITGLWQISGLRDLPIHHNIRFDLYYIRHRSFGLDMKILAATLLTVFDVFRIRKDWQRAQTETVNSGNADNRYSAAILLSPTANSEEAELQWQTGNDVGVATRE